MNKLFMYTYNITTSSRKLTVSIMVKVDVDSTVYTYISYIIFTEIDYSEISVLLQSNIKDRQRNIT